MKSLPSVWHVTREYAGLAEAGGVKDVVRGLAEAHARAGGAVTVVLPLYGFMPRDIARGRPLARFPLRLPDQDRGNAFFEEEVRIFSIAQDGVRLLLVDSPRFADKRGVYTYTSDDEAENRWRKRGTGHWDAHQMNLLVQRSALEAAVALGDVPDIFHCHDGHTAFLPALVREDARYAAACRESRAVVTIHNAGPGYHQEVWDRDFAGLLTGLAPAVLAKGALHGTEDPLLLAGSYGGLATVSPWYAEELLAEQDREMADGLGRALREQGIGLTGITNGIDPRPWDPRVAHGLPFTFDPLRGDLDGKRGCRRALCVQLGLREEAEPGPLYAFVGRLTGQKGIDVLVEALALLAGSGQGRRFVILGQGESDQEQRLARLAASSGGGLVFAPRYDPALAALIFAASDFFLVPSAYEPCGLTDFIAQVSGSIPVVHSVGGLKKVRDGETGFSYARHAAADLAAAIERTTELFRSAPALLDSIRRTGFAEVFSRHSWDRVLAEGYVPFYRAGTGEAWTPR